MNKNIRNLFMLIASSLLPFSCAEKENINLETENFTSIFDSNSFITEYLPIDIQQTPDGGYLILAERSLDSTEVTGAYLMKADKFGNFVQAMELGDTVINPIGPLNVIDGQYHFFCMSSSNEDYSQAKLATIDANLTAITIQNAGGLTYPEASSVVDNKLLLLTYNNGDKTSVVSEVTTGGTVTELAAYTVGVGEDSEDPIIEHHLKEGRQFPFAVGRTSTNTYYYNGFYEYNFSVVFVNPGADDPQGVVQGQSDHGGFSSIVPISGNKFAASRFNFGDNYLLPNTVLDPGDFSTSPDKGGIFSPELVEDARVKIHRAIVGTQNILIYGSDTRSKQIGLFYYDEATGTFLGSRYIGFSNPFQVAAMGNTSDGGIIVCGTTYLAGRFPRICLTKLSKEEIESDIK